MHIGLIGYGNIAETLIALLAKPGAPEVARVSVLVKPGRAAQHGGTLANHPAVIDFVETGDELIAAGPDLVVECAGQTCVAEVVPKVLASGTDVVVISIGALSDDALFDVLTAAATKGGSRIVLPAGAVGGIDLLSALSAAGDLELTYRGVKPPKAWKGTPAQEALDLDGLVEAAVFFRGTAREAASKFPKNANVAATLALAGPGLDATRVELVADPAATGNRHSYEVRSPAASYRMDIENLPSVGNSKTSVSTIYSVLREIRNRVGPVVI